MAVRFNLYGDVEMRKNIRIISGKSPHIVADATHEEFEIDAEEVRRRVPVRTGDLLNTVDAPKPEIKNKVIYATITAGDDDVEYAMIVHEDLEAHHDIGQAKYIESVIKESAPHIARRIAARVDFQRVLR